MKLNKKLFSIFTVLIAALGLSACDQSNQSAVSEKKEATLAETLASTKTIRVGTEGTYPPFTFHDKDGKLTGFDVEVVREVAKRLGLKVEFFETQWDAMFAGLNAKRFDIIANQVDLTNPERQQKYLLSEPYNFERAVIVTSADSEDLTALEQVKGKKSAQSINSSYYVLAKENGAEILPVEGMAPALELVKQKRADLTFNGQLAILDYFKQQPNSGLKIAYKDDNKIGSGFVFLKGNDEVVAQFNRTLNEMRQDGTLKALSIQWFGDDVTE
ncbi:amino acid ABC transporter substrate-binding protein, PAAT family (TC 3.A.1.3.-) [Pasteurella testudinis DSM 23072]|uniref:Amino acid ABC transporter substrate-binding protein, PAAT family (TC 3.A.1.3.-) n=1 Tax=Pasteurella testudinis DSM 23072 TaxID=1122938 RepID=A0A1W1VBD0_9PAST|nr:amino acid ABC transporter substrate-binding protein [Pasteurella testudinis]SMB90596.1 amino acid ABC transporter substrate-binding protein, PAAT family (TC 3.A.1.3.-) [Pasteurella testudinis DSM 23072]SUB52834.1 ABC transporter arginine-binding protein [Pasteurella testudinis]